MGPASIHHFMIACTMHSTALELRLYSLMDCVFTKRNFQEFPKV